MYSGIVHSDTCSTAKSSDQNEMLKIAFEIKRKRKKKNQQSRKKCVQKNRCYAHHM